MSSSFLLSSGFGLLVVLVMSTHLSLTRCFILLKSSFFCLSVALILASERNICLSFSGLDLCLILKLNLINASPLVLCFFLLDERICSPPFMVLNADCSPDVLEQIRRQGLTFPFSEFCFLLFRSVAKRKFWQTSSGLIMISIKGKELSGLRWRN